MTSTVPVPDLAELPRAARMAPSTSVGGLRRLAVTLGPPLGMLVALIGAWYVTTYLLVDPQLRFLLPPPHAVIRVAFLDAGNRDELFAGLALSARVAMTGLAVAVLIGTFLAIVMSQSRALERALFPYAVILQTVPILALVPLFGYWFGFGFTSRVLVCVLIAIFPIIANALFGLRSVDPGLHDLFTLHRASRLKRLVKLQVPAAGPAIFTGLRISAGLSVIGAIVGDFFFQQGQPGIGQLIYIYPKRLQSEMLVGAVILASLFGLAVFLFFGAVARRFNAWHESEHTRPNAPTSH